MGLESPMLPAPSIVLLLVKGMPEPKIQLVEVIVTLPAPVRVVGWLISMQLRSPTAMVPVLLMVPSVDRLYSLDRVSIPALVGTFTLPSRVPFWLWMVPVPLVFSVPPFTVPVMITVEPLSAWITPPLLLTVVLL